MESFSSSDDPNELDSLPSEAVHRAQNHWVPSQTIDPPGQQRRRKKPKVEANEYDVQLEQLQHELAQVRERLRRPRQEDAHTGASCELARQCIEAKQKAAGMERKLAEHTHWVQRVSSLMETAPLFIDARARACDEESKGTEIEASLQTRLRTLNRWRGECTRMRHARYLLDKRFHAAVLVAHESASRLLCDAAKKAPSFDLSCKFESYGWKIATGFVMSNHMGFCCHRLLPAGMHNKIKDVAMALWNFVERDEIFRTFVPLVQDSIITYQETDCSLSCRVVQLSQEMNQQAVATVESISSSRDDDGRENSWQISMEAVHDHYLCTFVADASDHSVIPNTAPPVTLDLGLQMSKLNMHNKFLMGARVSKTEEGVDIMVVGTARFDLPCYKDPAFDLLQHFVSHLPVYEDLHLTPLNDSQPADVRE
ncbi:hypothetical protein PsorP6_014283 [Peronosclerospora sorghi]|uniref:Uncharacterized protein n=1 Tax=Peronosclerospora sorghi TaxID=230839 RepID=A0ACC0VG37_9STRA|nr:hypothetical protein PsorP6_014283 [Peronosclerospora sorghi]